MRAGGELVDDGWAWTFAEAGVGSEGAVCVDQGRKMGLAGPGHQPEQQHMITAKDGAVQIADDPAGRPIQAG